MDKKIAKELQKALCFELQDYYEDREYNLNKKEWNFEKENIRIPFFLMATRGTYITIRPSIVYKSEGLFNDINSIVDMPILSNGFFIAGNQLNSSLEISASDLPYQDKVTEIAEMYYLRLLDFADINWVVEWHKAYMDRVGWHLIGQMIEETSLYNLYKNFFKLYLKSLDGNKSNVTRLDFGSHATMIYLGYKNKEIDADELVEKTLQNFENSLFSQRALEIQSYF